MVGVTTLGMGDGAWSNRLSSAALSAPSELVANALRSPEERLIPCNFSFASACWEAISDSLVRRSAACSTESTMPIE